LLGKSWTGRRVARILFPEKYDTEALKAENIPPLQMHKIAEVRMWESLTEEERRLCEERAKAWDKGIDIPPEDCKKSVSLLPLICILTCCRLADRHAVKVVNQFIDALSHHFGVRAFISFAWQSEKGNVAAHL
jgi:hypothetical protein